MVSMIAHTPGPWIAREMVSGHFLVMAEETSDSVAQVNGRTGDGSNARLIAAAPELRAALRALLLQALQSAAMFERDDAVIRARAAIAKATGA